MVGGVAPVAERQVATVRTMSESNFLNIVIIRIELGICQKRNRYMGGLVSVILAVNGRSFFVFKGKGK